MLRDVFYYGQKPNAHPREKFATDIHDARIQATTEHFWIINEYCDYRGFDWDFDFEFLADEDVWAENHNNIWPSQFQKDSGTWLCPKEHSDILIYRADVTPLKRKKESIDNWKFLDDIDKSKFDFSWHPDPTDPPFIYKWGCKFYPVELKSCLEYHVHGATEVKYMSNVVELLPSKNLVEYVKVDRDKFDLSWRPDPLDPPYIYVWGNKYDSAEVKPTLEYHSPGATDKKYMGILDLEPEWDRWKEYQKVKNFDYSWRPDPNLHEDPYIYVWGNKFIPAEIQPTIEYYCPGATEKKYMGDVEVEPLWNKWRGAENVNKATFDFSWRPDPREPAYIYTWGNKYIPAELQPTLEYVCEGATERKYMGDVDVLPQTNRWKVFQAVENFDFSWRPDPREPAYIYTWGNKYIPAELQPTLEYHCPDATEIKYMGDVDVVPEWDRWKEYVAIDKTKFDMSWRPDPREPAYIYVWGNKWVEGELKSTIEYYCEGATEKKYMGIAPVLPELERWKILQSIDKNKFDLTWRPDPREPAYIYVWGNKWIPGELKSTIEYHCPGAIEKKYMGEADVLPEFDRWNIVQDIDKTKFDLTWRPDPREPAYIYVWGNKHIPGELKSTLEYHVPGAIEKKYIGDVDVVPEYNRWNIIQEIDKSKFDLTWRPDPREPAYIYVWGNKHIPGELKSTIEYYCEGATEKKYMGIAPIIPESKKWNIIQDVDTTQFDLTWRPDPREPAYIYTWGNKYVPAEILPTLEYHCENATERKYMGDVIVVPEYSRWKITQEVENFDFSWRPDPREPAYIYVWGNKHIPGELKPTIEYYCSGATEKKYMGIVDVVPDNNWKVYQQVDTTLFDITWRPDPREPAYIYVWGNKWVPGEIKPTIEYHCKGATEIKYMGIAPVVSETDKWKMYIPVDESMFDMTWRPDPREPAYIYVWGNKYVSAELRPTLEYYCEGATEKKYMGEVAVLPQWENYKIHALISDFDFTWMPDPREPAYIYTWGNKWVSAELEPTLEYYVDGATERKYMGNVNVLSEADKWKEYQLIDKTKFDLTWRPDPREPAYIYVWGNKHISAELKPTLEYHCPGATEKKYMGIVEVLPELDRWREIQQIDKTKFDLTWRPDPREPDYIYVWGNKYIPGHLQSTLEYHVPGAIEKKYMGEVDVIAETDRWNIVQEVEDFDFTWRPDPREPAYIYIWGNKYIPAELKSTIEYHVPGATEKKYMGIVTVKPELERYKTLIPVDKSSFDFRWRPDPREPAYIYVWGNQSNSAEIEPTIEYYCDGAIERKYMNDSVATTLPDIENWKILVPVDEFDFTWRPDPHSPPYIYVFGNQWHDAMTEPTIEYHVPGATDKKYITDVVAKVSSTQENWRTLLPVEGFDYSWRPNPHSTPYIYVFGNQWNPIELEHTVEYHVPGATDYKYVTDIIAYLKSTSTDVKWKQLIPVEFFDFSWRPDPREPALIYVFGNKYNDSETEPTVEYHCNGATERKYLKTPVAIPQAELQYWSISNNDDLENFDFTWRPNPHSPPQIYQWADNGPRYTVPGATEVVYMEHQDINKRKVVNRYKIETTLEDLINQHPDEVFWALNPDLDYSKFDFSWRPNESNFRHINVFGNEYSKNTHTYYINGPMYMMGHREYNYVEEQSVNVDTNLSMFYIDRSNPESQNRFKELQTRYPQLQKTRYLNSWVDTINRCITKSETKLFYVLNSELDYSEFEFDFYPSPWQEKMVHVFGTQWSHWGNTYLINGETFPETTKYVKIIEHLNALNFVKNKRAKATNVLYDIVYIDHGNQFDYPANAKIVKYNNSYLNTFRDILKLLPEKKEHYIWICSSVCDYKDFDFSYICDPFAKDQLHVFPSNKQKFGDTFLVDVNKLRSLIGDMLMLEDYEKVNYNQHLRASRLQAPTITTEFDTHVASVLQDYDFPYAHFATEDNSNIKITDVEPISLWSNETKNIVIHSTGGSVLTIPKEAKNYIEGELYDYPYITRAPKLVNSKPMDIVFLSNGENCADENYEHLLSITKNVSNRIVRVDGVNGRKQAYHAAAEASNTPWMFTVFAKLKVNKDFDWNWQPDRLQLPKHYIFTALNPLNNLVYGHQAMIAYNKKLTLMNEGYGLDFTLDDPHESVNMLSGVATFNTDEYSTWRTAFREVIKLRHDTSDISKERLEKWLSVAEGKFSEFCLNGANDAIEYYESVNGDYSKLKLSYEWKWLNEYFTNKYKL